MEEEKKEFNDQQQHHQQKRRGRGSSGGGEEGSGISESFSESFMPQNVGSMMKSLHRHKMQRKTKYKLRR